MPLNNAGLNAMANHLGTIATHMSLHTADPGTSGTSESTAGRQAITWDAATGSGDLSTTGTLNFTGGAASGPCTHLGLWSASTGGTFYGGFALTGDQTFNASGEYSVTDLTLDGSST